MYTGRKTPMYIVRSLSMTNWLCNNGFKILKVEDSEKDDRLKVFLFEDTSAVPVLPEIKRVAQIEG